MLGRLFRKNPLKDLQKRYEALLQEARDLQRGGDVVGAAARTAEADAVRRELDALESATR